MADIRIVRPRGSHLWLWSGVLAGLALVALALSWVFGDPTMRGRNKDKEAALNAQRAPVTPLRAVRFESALPLETRQIGRLLYLDGTAESRQVRGAVWVKTANGRRILVRFEPDTSAKGLRWLGYGSRVQANGYVTKIGRAELNAWLDSLGVVLPRPRPGEKFGDLPDSNFVRVDSLFIKDYYLSVRSGGLASVSRGEVSTPSAPPRRRRTDPADRGSAPPAAPEPRTDSATTPTEPVPAPATTNPSTPQPPADSAP